MHVPDRSRAWCDRHAHCPNARVERGTGVWTLPVCRGERATPWTAQQRAAHKRPHASTSELDSGPQHRSSRRSRRNQKFVSFVSFVLQFHSPQYVTRTRYFNVAAPSAATGTLNCAAHASVFVASCDDLRIRQVPPIGSFTSIVMGVDLWLRSTISYSDS